MRLYEGTGRFVLNGRSLEDFFPQLALRLRVLEPLKATELEGQYDVYAKLEGGGYTGQSDALRLGISRALVGVNPDLRTSLKRQGLLTRDARAASSARSTGCARRVARRSSPSGGAESPTLLLLHAVAERQARLFGTDGVRGRANSDLTPELAFDLARAAGEGSEGPVVCRTRYQALGPDAFLCAPCRFQHRRGGHR